MTLLIRLFFAAFLATALSGTVSAEQRSAPVEDYIVTDAQSFETTLNATWSTKGKDAKGWLADGDKASTAEITARRRTTTPPPRFSTSTMLELGSSSRAPISPSRPRNMARRILARNAGSAAYSYTGPKPGPTGGGACGPGRKPCRAPAMAARASALQGQPRARAHADVQQAYDEAFNEHGFRMLDYTSDNKLNPPRICV